MKNKVLIASAIVGVVGVAGLASCLKAGPHHKHHGDRMYGEWDGERGYHKGKHRMRGIKFALSKLDLSEEQKAQVKDIMQSSFRGEQTNT